MSDPIITLERFTYGPRDHKHLCAGTFGEFLLPMEHKTLYTVEREPANNKPFVSCIPEGVFPMVKVPSPIVERTTNGEFTEGWLIQNVPDRSEIMIHPANWPHDLEGCVGVGFDFGFMSRLAVLRSRKAFSYLMGLLTEDAYVLHVKSKTFWT